MLKGLGINQHFYWPGSKGLKRWAFPNCLGMLTQQASLKRIGKYVAAEREWGKKKEKKRDGTQ